VEGRRELKVGLEEQHAIAYELRRLRADEVPRMCLR